MIVIGALVWLLIGAAYLALVAGEPRLIESLTLAYFLPFTLALVLGLFLVATLTRRRIGPVHDQTDEQRGG